jgi:hypothetical protein
MEVNLPGLHFKNDNLFIETYYLKYFVIEIFLTILVSKKE